MSEKEAELLIYKTFFEKIENYPRGKRHQGLSGMDYIKARIFDVKYHIENISDWVNQDAPGSKINS